ncbi:hypothetical protein P5673_000577 [Acropora cervicornis]|uniref:Uncharacterized protein n=1 Tax=Acropora cervicornis TaxID=6130 RepID=A0AAD9VHX2_ACRCE|nr:hypothetical protein P5673_000577 [Acropora cervicornis]
MSDSDETICDDSGDRSQMSPSVIASLESIDSLDQKAKSNGGSTTRNSCGSPEFLPPSKIQRLSEENEEEVKDESADLELQASQVDEIGKSNAADRLKSMKDKHDKIEDQLVTIEANVRNGWLLLFLFKCIALRNSPVFLEVKKHMTELKTQLSDFAQYQQQQRQEIVNSSCKSQLIHHENEAQWTHEKKQKILKLASQQRELLKLLHCNKNLVEKVQTLKEMAKLHTKKIMPIIEVHHKSLETNLAQGETNKNIHQAASTKTIDSDLNQHGATTFVESQTARIFKQTQEQSARRFNQESSSLNQFSRGTSPFHHQSSTQTVNPSTSQLTASPLFVRSQIPSASPNHTCAIPLYSTSSTTVSQTSIAKSLPTQQRAHNVILTAGQLYQVGDKQIYVLPHGLNTDIVSSMTATQVNQKPQGTSEATSQTKTVSAGAKETSSSLVTSVVKSTPRFTLSRASNFILHSQTQVPQWHPTCISPVTYTGVTAPLSSNPAPRNNIASALPKDDTQSQPSTSSAVYQNTCTDLSVRLTDHKTKGQFLFQAVQTKGTSHTLQRRNSFGSDNPDLKSLLSHKVIEPGSQVLSVEFEVR